MTMGISTYNVKGKERFELSSTSKGNQIKWVKGGKFLKADSMGYESIVEVLVSELESFIEDFNYVDYSLCLIEEDGICYKGCVSDYFLSDNEYIISVYRILEQYFSSEEDLRRLCNKSGKDLVIDIVKICSEVTGIEQGSIMGYFSKIIKLDSIILNEDRHLNNIVFIKEISKGYKFAPVFDNGLSLLSDTNRYSYGCNIPFMVRKVKAKPFSTDFSKQLKYFSEYEPLRIRYNDFLKRLEDCYVEFKTREFDRSVFILKTQLEKLKGVAWIEC